MKNKKILIILVGLTSLIVSCTKYLDINPKSTISEDQLFTSETGFQQALDGVYSLLASRNLFGDNLSMGFTSALAQNYNLPQGANFYATSQLNYNSAEVRGYSNGIWNAAYNAIAGTNKIIQNTDKMRSVLTEPSYSRIRGEALALRAYLHFEILRLYGPEYVSGRLKKAIPYKTDVNQFAVIPSTTTVVVERVLDDLSEAEKLLSQSDPIVSGDLNRRIKMNFYAVKALQARVYLYSGDKNKASDAAILVTNANKFSFVTVGAASDIAANRDRLYLTEQIFGLRVSNLRNWADPGYFRSGSSMNRSQADYDILYETSSGNGTDIRYLFRLEPVLNMVFPSKFWQTFSGNSAVANRLDQLIPMLRLSEMYYILAECASNPASGVGYLNVIRQNRNLPILPSTLDQSELDTEITKEYQKEFYAEGQLFFYYKRKNTVRMQFSTSDISLSQYTLPIPDSELEFNPNYN